MSKMHGACVLMVLLVGCGRGQTDSNTASRPSTESKEPIVAAAAANVSSKTLVGLWTLDEQATEKEMTRIAQEAGKGPEAKHLAAALKFDVGRKIYWITEDELQILSNSGSKRMSYQVTGVEDNALKLRVTYWDLRDQEEIVDGRAEMKGDLLYLQISNFPVMPLRKLAGQELEQRLAALPAQDPGLSDDAAARINQLLADPPPVAERKIREQPDLVKIVDSDGNTALHRAVDRHQVALVQLLLQHKADPNALDAHKRTPLHVAASKRRAGRWPEICKLLLDAGADINAANEEEYTPLRTALAHRSDQVAEFLRSRGALERRQDEPVTVALLGRVGDIDGLQWDAVDDAPADEFRKSIKCPLTVKLPGDRSFRTMLDGELHVLHEDTVITAVNMYQSEVGGSLVETIANVNQLLAGNHINLRGQEAAIVDKWKAADPVKTDVLEPLEVKLDEDIVATFYVVPLHRGPKWTYSVELTLSHEAKVARIREVATEWCLAPSFTLEHDTPQVYRVVFSPNSKLLAMTSVGFVHLWDLEAKQRVAKLGKEDAQEGSVFRAAFSADGRSLAAIYGGKTVRIWDVESRTPLREARADDVYFDDISADFSKLLGSTTDDRIVVRDFELRQNAVVISLEKQKNGIVAFTPNGNQVIVGPRDVSGRTRVFDASTGEEAVKLKYADGKGVGGLKNDFTYSRDGQIIYLADFARGVSAFDLATGRQTFEVLLRANHRIAVSADGKYLAGGSAHDTGLESVWIMDLQTKQRVAELGKFPEPVSSVSFSPNGNLLAAAVKGEKVMVWDISQIQ